MPKAAAGFGVTQIFQQFDQFVGVAVNVSDDVVDYAAPGGRNRGRRIVEGAEAMSKQQHQDQSRENMVAESELQHALEWTLPDGWESVLPGAPLTSDVDRMRFVVRLARWNISNRTGGPFAAAVFRRGSGELTSIGVKRAVSLSAGVAHAEALAIALAQKRVGSHDLSRIDGATYELVTSGQPCVQCFGMVWWSGVTRLVVAATADDIENICGFDEGPIPADWKSLLEHRSRLPGIEVVTEVCRDEAREVLRDYTAMDGPNYSPGSP